MTEDCLSIYMKTLTMLISVCWNYDDFYFSFKFSELSMYAFSNEKQKMLIEKSTCYFDKSQHHKNGTNWYYITPKEMHYITTPPTHTKCLIFSWGNN